MGSIPPPLVELIHRAERLLGSAESRFDGAAALSVEDLLRGALASEEDRERRVQLSALLGDFQAFAGSRPPSRQDVDAQVVVSDTKAYAYLTLVPPRGGRTVGIQEVLSVLEHQGIRHGLNRAGLEAACEHFARKHETIYSLKVAECRLPEEGEDARIEFSVRAFDKMILFDPETPYLEDPSQMLEQVQAGRIVGTLTPPVPGRPGYDIRGGEIPAPPGAGVKSRFGEGLRVEDGGRTLLSRLAGVLVSDRETLDVVPFYVVQGELSAGQDVEFHGNVLVLGAVTGPVRIKAEDVYVCGNASAATITAAGDVWIGGAFEGRKEGRIDADGRVAARSISDAVVGALGDVLVRHSISHSEVASNASVFVTARQGAIVGGSIGALRGIVSKNLGSDFGTYTATAVGKDFLTPRRLGEIERRIREHEEKLAKIELLRSKLAEAKIEVSRLPRDKQDLYISVVRKELAALEEISSLRRGREKFQTALSDFLQASIRVVDQLHPPVKVQIGEAIREIRERMEKVVLTLDGDRHIRARKGDDDGA